MITWDPLAPGEDLLSSINWATRLAAGDSVSSSSWSTTSPISLIVVPAPTVGLLTNVFISGATVQQIGTVCFITNTIVTATGQTEVETAQFVIAPK